MSLLPEALDGGNGDPAQLDGGEGGLPGRSKSCLPLACPDTASADAVPKRRGRPRKVCYPFRSNICIYSFISFE